MRRLMPPLVAMTLLLAACGGVAHPHQQRVQTKYGVAAHSPTFGLPPKGAHPYRLSPKVVPTIEMFDTVTLSTLAGLQPAALAGYTSGYWPTYVPLTRAYPALAATGHVVSINVYYTYHGNCLDVEPGDATPAQAAVWVGADLIAGFWKPCVYASLSTMAQVRYYLNAANIPRSAYRLWDADWTYYAHLDAGYDATQWTDHAYSRNLDESTVSTTTFFQGPPPAPPRPHCFGPNWERSNSTCQHIRPLVASWSRARDSSLRALNARHCLYSGIVNGTATPLFHNRTDCNALTQRATYFAHLVIANLY